MTREEQIKEYISTFIEQYAESAGCNPKEVEHLGNFIRIGINWADRHPKDEKNWQQARIQAAIAAMQLIQTDETFKRWVQERVEEGGVYYEEYPNVAVEIADHLIVALKQEPWVLKENDIKL